jgi:lipoate-protein ligase A
MPPLWRLVDSEFVSPAESAALDEAILEAHVGGEVPNTLHFYRRGTPTISVGYFQKISESLDIEECRARGVAVVRRKSGGSSIYTDAGQLIYGLVMHDSELPADRQESFCAVCSALAKAISSFGVAARFRPMNDIEIDGRKVSGNAQLRRKGSVLQHGTVLVDTDVRAMDAVLRQDPAKHETVMRPSDRIVTLAKLLGRAPEMREVKERIVSEISSAFGTGFERGELTSFERALVQKLVRERYGRDEWNFKF